MAQVKSVHPPNQELMSDWLYCHKHDHGNSGHSHHDGQISSVIGTREELISYLTEKGTGSEVILEDENDLNHNLIVNVISPSLITCSLITYNCDLTSDSVDGLNHFSPVSSMLIEYKILMNQNEEEKNELKQLRCSFTTAWVRISDHLMTAFTHELIHTTRSFLPKSSLVSENKFFRALIARTRRRKEQLSTI